VAGIGQDDEEEEVPEKPAAKPAASEPPPTPAPKPPEPAAKEDEDDDEPVEDVPEGEKVELNGATFEQLRDLGLSVTQATRVITYRERQSGFDSLDDLDSVPGMPKAFLRKVKPRLKLGQ